MRQVLGKKCAETAGLSVALRITASSDESFSMAYNLFSTSSNILLVLYIGWTDEDPCEPEVDRFGHCGRNDWDPLTDGITNHDSLPAIRVELSADGQHSAKIINIFQFKQEVASTETHPSKATSKSSWTI